MASLDELINEEGQPLEPDEAEDKLDRQIEAASDGQDDDTQSSDQQAAGPAAGPAAQPEGEAQPAEDQEPAEKKDESEDRSIPEPVALAWKKGEKEERRRAEMLEQQLVDKELELAEAKAGKEAGTAPLEEWMAAQDDEDVTMNDVPVKVQLAQRKWEEKRQQQAAPPDAAQITQKIRLQQLQAMEGRERALATMGAPYLAQEDQAAIMGDPDPVTKALNLSWERIMAKGSEADKAAALALYPPAKTKPKNQPGGKTGGASRDEEATDEKLGIDDQDGYTAGKEIDDLVSLINA